MLSFLLFSSFTSAFAQGQAGPPDLVGTLANIPFLIVGLMVAGALVGVAITLFSRISNESTHKVPIQPSTPRVQPKPAAEPSDSEPLPGIAPVDMVGGFDPASDFEEPTCFAELPRKE